MQIGLCQPFIHMNQTYTLNRILQLLAVVATALTLKLCYSTASVNQLHWILGPTAVLVELVSGTQFEFESYAGYTSSDRTFVIATSCAGVNFLVTSFLMLSLRKLWRDRARKISWVYLPAAALFAYLATLVANTVRISTALQLRRVPLEIGWLSPNQFHRLEGIFIYFGFLLLLFIVSEKMSAVKPSSSGPVLARSGTQGLVRQTFFPLLIYYTTMLGIPLANGAYRNTGFLEHSLFVLLTPLLFVLPLAALRLHQDRRPVVSVK
jgi:exosortase K